MAKHITEAASPFVCGNCGNTKAIPFKNESMVLTAKDGATVAVNRLSGIRCECGEVEFDHASQARYVAAGDRLVLEERDRAAAALKATRLKLHLTQRQASSITGGGHNAFSRYERGAAIPLQAVKHLFYLLDRHPELLNELPGVGEQLKHR